MMECQKLSRALDFREVEGNRILNSNSKTNLVLKKDNIYLLITVNIKQN